MARIAGHIHVPESTSQTALVPAFDVTVGQRAVYAGSRSVAPVRHGRIAAEAKGDGADGFFIAELSNVLRTQRRREQERARTGQAGRDAPLLVAVDRGLPYRPVASVLYTAAQAGYVHFEFAVRDGKGRFRALVYSTPRLKESKVASTVAETARPAGSTQAGKPALSRRVLRKGAGMLGVLEKGKDVDQMFRRGPAQKGRRSSPGGLGAGAGGAGHGSKDLSHLNLTVVVTKKGYYVKSRFGSECQGKGDTRLCIPAPDGAFTKGVRSEFGKLMWFLFARKYGDESRYADPLDRHRVTVVPEADVPFQVVVDTLDALREIPRDATQPQAPRDIPPEGCSFGHDPGSGAWTLPQDRLEHACMYHLVTLAIGAL